MNIFAPFLQNPAVFPVDLRCRELKDMVEVDDGPSEAGRWSKKKPLVLSKPAANETSARLTIDDFPIDFPMCMSDMSIFDEDFEFSDVRNCRRVPRKIHEQSKADIVKSESI
jgi:hypothetical protein